MGKGRPNCAAIGCINNYNNCNYSFFHFPKEESRARTWAIAAGRADLVKDLKGSTIKTILCGIHFENRMFVTLKHNRLGKWAIPTIFPALEGSSTSSLYNEGPLSSNRIIINNGNDLLKSQHLQKSPDPTPTHQNYGLEPNKDRGTEGSLKRKREEELELTISNSRESDAQPSTSQTTKEVNRPLISTKTYTSYKQKYNELLVAYNNLEQELFHLKNNTKKSRSTFNVTSPSSTMVKPRKLNRAKIGHSQEEIGELAKQWTDEFSRLRADQQIYAKEAISEVFNAAKMNNLHSKSVKINDDCANIVSVKTDETEIDTFDEHLSSSIEDFRCASVKTEDTYKKICDDNDVPSTSVNSEFRISVKIEETEIDYESNSVKTEETDDIYDEDNDRCDYYKPVNLIPDSVDVSVKSEDVELYEDNSDISDNQCFLKMEEDYNVSTRTSTVVKKDDDNEDVLNVDVNKVEKDKMS